jgi:hypothetical protein
MKSSWQTDPVTLTCRWSDLGSASNTAQHGWEKRQVFRAVIGSPFLILPATAHLGELRGSTCVALIATPDKYRNSAQSITLNRKGVRP